MITWCISAHKTIILKVGELSDHQLLYIGFLTVDILGEIKSFSGSFPGLPAATLQPQYNESYLIFLSYISGT